MALNYKLYLCASQRQIIYCFKKNTMLKTAIAKFLSKIIHHRNQKWALNPEIAQKNVLEKLVKQAQNTVFGTEHNFANIKTYEDFKKNVPIADYETLRPYIERALAGEPNVLWRKKPIYFAKTSGTTSGTKYIPITNDSIGNHTSGARDAFLAYIYEKKNADFLKGKIVYLSGSPVLETQNGIHIGRLSGISNHHIPSYLRRNQAPTHQTNCIADWEQKIDAITTETMNRNVTVIGGIPPWAQMYFDKLSAMKDGAPIAKIYKNLSLFVFGGVNFEPYRNKIEQSLGKKIDSIELFPASEGFFAYQNQQNDHGLLLRMDAGIFYEFIEASAFFEPNPKRICIDDVQLNTNYVLILNTNAGLWGYNIGDTIKFVGKNPYKIRVTGRIKHFISAFGEHVIGEEVDNAMRIVTQKHSVEVVEFHVAPQVSPAAGLPYHEWFIEFGDKKPAKITDFAADLDAAMTNQNIYYKDLVVGNVLKPLQITEVKPKTFINYMKSEGKLGGQNKLPRLADNRDLADKLALN